MASMSVVNPETIRNHLTHKSPAKISYRFSKTKRFTQPSINCPIAFYSITSSLSKRKTSFGLGRKHDFSKDVTSSPPPTLYKYKSVFEDSKARGKTFGLSRDSSPDTSYLVPQLQRVPGPGQYENQFSSRMNTSYSMRPRTVDVYENSKTNKKSPGPGTYQTIELQPTSGRFKCSKFGDSKFAKFTDNRPRFQSSKETPGPLSYREGDSLSPTGKYVLSHRKGVGAQSFSKNARKTFVEQFVKNKRIPGPGSYECVSQFGVYGDAKFYQTLPK